MSYLEGHPGPDRRRAGHRRRTESEAATIEDQVSTEEEVTLGAQTPAIEVLPEPADYPAQGASDTSRPEPVVPGSEEPTATADVAPQTPNVPPEATSGADKATNAKKAPKEGNNGTRREGSKTSQVSAMLSAGGSVTKNHGLTVISEEVCEHRRYSMKGWLE